MLKRIVLVRLLPLESLAAPADEVPWRFASRQDLIRFCQGLFGLDCGPETVARGIG